MEHRLHGAHGFRISPALYDQCTIHQMMMIKLYGTSKSEYYIDFYYIDFYSTTVW